jgi:hypothetical protein
MNQHYHSIFVSRVAAALGAARAVSALTHRGVKGAVREVLIRELFRPLLPSDVGIGTGQIATSNGDLSPQQDVVIYDRRILPPVLFEAVLGVFPIEAVLATVEVKTTLTATEVASAHASASTIHTYQYLPGEDDNATGQPVVHSIEKIISSVFALDTDLKPDGKTELQRYQEIDRGSEPVVRSICISGRGYWYFSGAWRHVESDAQHSETVMFIIGLYDTLGRVAETRRRPKLVGYVM